MFSFFSKKQKPERVKPPEQAEFVLKPRADGKYDLCRLIKDIYWGDIWYYYKHIDIVNNEEEGRQMIANLKRPVIEL